MYIHVQKPGKKRSDPLGLFLKDAGCSSLRDYFRSADWRAVSFDALSRNERCLICNQVASRVHAFDHSPDTLSGRNHDKLVSLCNACRADLAWQNGVEQSQNNLMRAAGKSPSGRVWLGKIRAKPGHVGQPKPVVKGGKPDRRQRAMMEEGNVRQWAFDDGMNLIVNTPQGNIHWMFNDALTDERLLDFWPSTGTWHCRKNGRSGEAKDHWEALEIAKTIPSL